MAAIAVEIAGAVRERIAAATLTTAPNTIERSYADWAIELKEEEGLRVDVAPVITGQVVEPETQGSVQFTVQIDAAVRKKFGQSDLDDKHGRVEVAEVDKLMLLVEEILLLFVLLNELPGYTDAQVDNDQMPRIVVAPDKAMLRENKQFVGIVRMWLVVSKAA